MTRIRFKILKSSILLPLAVLLSLASSELEYYQDADPKLSGANLDKLIRLLEWENQNRAAASQSSDNDDPYIQLRSYRQEQQQQRYPHSLRPRNYNNPNEEDEEELINEDIDYDQQPYNDPSLALPYGPDYDLITSNNNNNNNYNNFNNNNNENEDLFLDYPEIPQHIDYERLKETENIRRLILENIIEKQRIKNEFLNRQREAQENLLFNNNEKDLKFTYSFDKPNTDNKEPFAVAPNDPRYYQTDDKNEAYYRFIQKNKFHQQRDPDADHPELPDRRKEILNKEIKEENNKKLIEKEKEILTTLEPNNIMKKPISKQSIDFPDYPRTNVMDIDMLPEPQRRAEINPAVISLDNKLNDDVYFVAVIAGCTAAAMFAIVLISLTWCRVSKAAADVEYPAYGVTGPNKDMSPSSDQRLAQSAQMYHFQHQKQQIIAMEKPSSNRDPTSVSEADSDEENEEGDYTVYECPGLAPTGEMEVKNPMFLDDPTPSTPGKSKKDDEDDDNDDA